MSKVIHFGHIDDNGNLHLNNERRFRDEIKALSSKPVIITVERKSKKRSTQQSRFYWGVVVPIIKDALRNAGYDEIKTNEDAHEVLKGLFNKASFTDKATGDTITYGRTTTALTTTEFMEYVAAIQQWAAEKLNCNIPDPHEFVE
jgi:hypothetical protein